MDFASISPLSGERRSGGEDGDDRKEDGNFPNDFVGDFRSDLRQENDNRTIATGYGSFFKNFQLSKIEIVSEY